MPSVTFADSYPMAVAYMQSYSQSRARRGPMIGPPPPPDMRLPRPLASVRLMLQRIHQPQEVMAAMWWYFVGGKSMEAIASALSYSPRHVYRLLAKGLRAMESLLSSDISITMDMLLPGEGMAEAGLAPGPDILRDDAPPWA